MTRLRGRAEVPQVGSISNFTVSNSVMTMQGDTRIVISRWNKGSRKEGRKQRVLADPIGVVLVLLVHIQVVLLVRAAPDTVYYCYLQRVYRVGQLHWVWWKTTPRAHPSGWRRMLPPIWPPSSLPRENGGCADLVLGPGGAGSAECHD